MDLLRPTYVHIHLNRLMSNYRYLQSLSLDHPFICPMIKANAYGHGDLAVAMALENQGCRYIGVASVEEGLNLRRNNVAMNILVFGFSGEEAVEELLQNQLTPVVSNIGQIECLQRKVEKPIKIHLKINTGMNRLGLVARDLQSLNVYLKKPSLFILEGIGTHLHSGDAADQPAGSAQQQILDFEKFSMALSDWNPILHVYNSSALSTLIANRQNLSYGIRPGLLTYGIDPEENPAVQALIKPVMELKSKVVAVQDILAGEVVSYGGTWQAQRPSKIAIVPAGYGDGICRSLSDSGKVLIRGKKLPICGRVCMDYTMVDCTDIHLDSQPLVGEEVVFIGEQAGEEIPLEEFSKSAQRIPYEVMTGISERVARFYGNK